MLQDAVDGMRAALTDRNPRYLDALSILGSLRCKQKQWHAAEQCFREAATVARTVLGGNHRNTLVFVHNQGRALSEQHRDAEAEVCFRECYESLRAQPDDHPLWSPLDAAQWLGESLVALAKDGAANNRDAALARLREAESLLVGSAERLLEGASLGLTEAEGASKAAEARDRVIELYEVWNTVEPDSDHAAKAGAWRRRAGRTEPRK